MCVREREREREGGGEEMGVVSVEQGRGWWLYLAPCTLTRVEQLVLHASCLPPLAGWKSRRLLAVYGSPQTATLPPSVFC